MPEQFVLAIDQGTTSSRAILFNKQGRPCHVAQKEFKQYYPHPGWVEQDPREILSSQIGVIAEVTATAQISLDDIVCAGITNQRETTIVWDKNTGEPVYNAIVWQCRRTADIAEDLIAKGYKELIRSKTGLTPDAYFSGTKIQWILDNVKGARQKAEAGDLLFGTVDTWLIWNLTAHKVHATDYTNASRTMLFNIHTRQWDEDLLSLLNIPASMLPEVRPSSGDFGVIEHQSLGGNIPITGDAGDQQAALFGQCCFEPGQAKNTYGTGCFMLMNTGDKAIESKSGLVTTIAASGIRSEDGTFVPHYALEGSVFVAGALMQWLRDGLRVLDNVADSSDIASALDSSEGVYIVPALTGLGAPYWDSYARGSIYGITRGTTREHIIRAALEALAYSSYDILNAMEEDAGFPLTRLQVDGGASNNDFLMQFQADILDTTVVRPQTAETTALGAAYLAGLSAGYWSSEEEIRENCEISATYKPKMTEEKRTELLKGWKKAIERTLS